MSATIGAVETAILLNVIADIYFKAKKANPSITPETVKAHIEGLEARAAANDAALGVDP